MDKRGKFSTIVVVLLAVFTIACGAQITPTLGQVPTPILDTTATPQAFNSPTADITSRPVEPSITPTPELVTSCPGFGILENNKKILNERDLINFNFVEYGTSYSKIPSSPLAGEVASFTQKVLESTFGINSSIECFYEGFHFDKKFHRVSILLGGNLPDEAHEALSSAMTSEGAFVKTRVSAKAGEDHDFFYYMFISDLPIEMADVIDGLSTIFLFDGNRVVLTFGELDQET